MGRNTERITVLNEVTKKYYSSQPGYLENNRMLIGLNIYGTFYVVKPNHIGDLGLTKPGYIKTLLKASVCSFINAGQIDSKEIEYFVCAQPTYIDASNNAIDGSLKDKFDAGSSNIRETLTVDIMLQDESVGYSNVFRMPATDDIEYEEPVLLDSTTFGMTYESVLDVFDSEDLEILAHKWGFDGENISKLTAHYTEEMYEKALRYLIAAAEQKGIEIPENYGPML